MGRPAMRFVPVKSADQQAVLMAHRARELLVSERTALVNQMQGFWVNIASCSPRGSRR
ncbi:MAG: hypothetical protein ACREVK_01745 [Gammaproteobacteria bacterium]